MQKPKMDGMAAPRTEAFQLSVRVYVVVLNWNGWQDTIECLQSLCLLVDEKVRIVVCDNASTDGSLERIRSWAAGDQVCTVADARYHFLLERPVRPPRVQEWRVGQPVSSAADADLILIPTGSNRGFAGGCNAGLRFVLECGDGDFVWLLNNDTIVQADALRHLLEKMRERPDIGICGSKLVYYFEPEVMQCPGGYDFNSWTARVQPIAARGEGKTVSCVAEVERKLKYVTGASSFVRVALLEQVGLMNEQYFLYFEEIDWATRAHGRFALGYCASSRVYHKEGRSIGSHRKSGSRSLFSERWLSRNRIVFMRTYYPARVIVCLGWVVLAALYRLAIGRTELAKTIVAGSWNGLWCKLGEVPRESR
jgi:GT2 family glycosyltransferase